MKQRPMTGAEAPRSTILVRAAIGIVFLSEGIQKFLYPAALGAGRFAKIGIPAAHLMGPFMGIVETVCGMLILVGFSTRFAAIPLVVNMVVAIASTKLPILLGHGYWIFAHTLAPKAGIGAFFHESRTDLSMLFCSIYLAIVGAGPLSLDARRAAHTRESSS